MHMGSNENKNSPTRRCTVHGLGWPRWLTGFGAWATEFPAKSTVGTVARPEPASGRFSRRPPARPRTARPRRRGHPHRGRRAGAPPREAPAGPAIRARGTVRAHAHACTRAWDGLPDHLHSHMGALTSSCVHIVMRLLHFYLPTFLLTSFIDAYIRMLTHS